MLKVITNMMQLHKWRCLLGLAPAYVIRIRARLWLSYLKRQSAAQAIFGPPGICK